MHVPAKLNQETIPEGMRIELRGGAHIHFTAKFEYLGSKVTSKLSDSLDVKTRIAIANSQMVQMKDLLRWKGISRKNKNFLYQAIPLLTVIRVCDTWAVKEEEKRMLEVFHHGAIIIILGISRQRVRDENITKSAARNEFLSMPIMMNIVKRRVLKYIGKVVREEKQSITQIFPHYLLQFTHACRGTT
jgi:hypothetical protein